MSAALAVLEARSCPRCANATVDATPVRCPFCGAAELQPVVVSAVGVVQSATTIRLAPPGVDVPYTVAYADFEPHVRLFARVATSVETPVTIGDTVRIELLEDPVERFRFVPEGA